MIIGSDFDGVIADTFSLLNEEVTLNDIISGDIDVRLIQPLSQNMVSLLNNNKIQVIITARDVLTPVYKWLTHYAPDYRGTIQSSKVWNDSKAIPCLVHGVDIFIDDDPGWVDEINSAGMQALLFVRDIHSDPYKLLSEAFLGDSEKGTEYIQETAKLI